MKLYSVFRALIARSLLGGVNHASILGVSVFGVGMLNAIVVYTSPLQAAVLQHWEFDPNTRELSVNLPQGITPRFLVMARPTRIVLEIPSTQMGQAQTEVAYSGLVSTIRVARPNRDTLQLVMELAAGTRLDPQHAELASAPAGEAVRWTLRPLLVDAEDGRIASQDPGQTSQQTLGAIAHNSDSSIAPPSAAMPPEQGALQTASEIPIEPATEPFTPPELLPTVPQIAESTASAPQSLVQDALPLHESSRTSSPDSRPPTATQPSPTPRILLPETPAAADAPRQPLISASASNLMLPAIGDALTNLPEVLPIDPFALGFDSETKVTVPDLDETFANAPTVTGEPLSSSSLAAANSPVIETAPPGATTSLPTATSTTADSATTAADDLAAPTTPPTLANSVIAAAPSETVSDTASAIEANANSETNSDTASAIEANANSETNSGTTPAAPLPSSGAEAVILSSPPAAPPTTTLEATPRVTQESAPAEPIVTAPAVLATVSPPVDPTISTASLENSPENTSENASINTPETSIEIAIVPPPDSGIVPASTSEAVSTPPPSSGSPNSIARVNQPLESAPPSSPSPEPHSTSIPSVQPDSPPFLAVAPPTAGLSSQPLAVPEPPAGEGRAPLPPAPNVSVLEPTIAFGQPLPTAGGKALGETPQPSGPPPALTDVVLPAGTLLELRYPGPGPLEIKPDAQVQAVMVLETDLRDPEGRLVVPAGTQMVGRFEPTETGQRWVSEALIIGERQVILSSTSDYLASSPQVSAGTMAMGTGIGALALTVLTGFTGVGLLGGALLGATTVVGSAPQQVVLQPNDMIEVRVLEEVTYTAFFNAEPLQPRVAEEL